MGDTSLNTHLQSFDSPIAVAHDTLVIVLNVSDDHPENGLKTVFLVTKLAVKWARWLEIPRNLVQVMHICSAMLSPKRTFTCLLLLAAGCCCSCCCYLPLLKYFPHLGPQKGL